MRVKSTVIVVLVIVTAMLAATFLGGWHWKRSQTPTAGWAWGSASSESAGA